MFLKITAHITSDAVILLCKGWNNFDRNVKMQQILSFIA